MTIFDGVIAGFRDGKIIVHSPELPNELTVSHAGTILPIGTPVSVAIRPEKIFIEPEPAANRPNSVMAKVRDLGYFGGVTAYRMTTASGKLVAVNLTNTGREVNRRVDWDAEVQLSWSAESAILLTE
jgi:putrescine transport system ATP-binding protein